MKRLMLVGLLVLTPLLARSLARSARAAQVAIPTWALLAAAPLIPLVGFPILIHRTHWLALGSTFEPFDPEGPGRRRNSASTSPRPPTSSNPSASRSS